MTVEYRHEYGYKYGLKSDRSGIVLKPGETAKRFGGVEFLVTHDFIFGSETSGYGDLGICLYHFGRNLTEFGSPKAFLRELDEHDIKNLRRKSTHIDTAVNEFIELIELSRYHYERGEVVAREGRCRVELNHESVPS